MGKSKLLKIEKKDLPSRDCEFCGCSLEDDPYVLTFANGTQIWICEDCYGVLEDAERFGIVRLPELTR